MVKYFPTRGLPATVNGGGQYSSSPRGRPAYDCSMLYTPMASYPICALCREHVELEIATTDERGQAVHEECYASHLTSPKPSVKY